MGIRKLFGSEQSYQEYLIAEEAVRSEATNEGISFIQIIKMLLGFKSKNCDVDGKQEE